MTKFILSLSLPIIIIIIIIIIITVVLGTTIEWLWNLSRLRELSQSPENVLQSRQPQEKVNGTEIPP